MNEHEERIVMTLTPYLMAFPQSKMTAEGLIIYAKALKMLTIAEIDASMLKLMRTSRFFPTVAEILEQAEVMRDFVTEALIPSPDEAWKEATREAHDKFVYGEWNLSCPEVKQAVDNFGKMALCSLETDEMNTARAQFMRIYAAIVNRKREKKANIEVVASLQNQQVKELMGAVANRLTMKTGGDTNDDIRQLI